VAFHVVSIVFNVDEFAAVDGIGRVFQAFEEQGFRFHNNITDNDGAVSERSNGSGGDGTIHRIGVGKTCCIRKSKGIDGVPSIYIYVSRNENDQVLFFRVDKGAVESNGLGGAKAGRLQVTGDQIVLVLGVGVVCERSNGGFVSISVSISASRVG